VVVLDRMYSEYMKLALFGKDIDASRADIKRLGFDIVSEKPEMVLTFGGDGTFLKSEAAYPGVPKALIKRSPTCRLCVELPFDEVLSRIRWGDYSTHEIPKLEVCAGGKRWHALNDVVVKNANPRHAVRFNVNGLGTAYTNLIGDGLVVATTLGSTGYFKSITKRIFNKGIGVAFNNTSEYFDPVIVPEESFSMEVTVTRGPALVYADNQEDEVLLNDGDRIEIHLSEERAQVLTFDQ